MQKSEILAKRGVVFLNLAYFSLAAAIAFTTDNLYVIVWFVIAWLFISAAAHFIMSGEEAARERKEASE